MTITRSAFLDFISNPADVAFCEIVGHKGSSPREVGAWMLINRSGKTLGTIGGGQLEYEAVNRVKKQDWAFKFEFRMETKLGPEIGQCCGGKVVLSINRFTSELKANLLSRIDEEASNCPEILIFGAGNIGISLAKQLYHMPLRVTIIDNRKEYLSSLNRNYRTKFSLVPEQEIRNAHPNSAFIIVTHDHGLDFMLCYEALLRDDIAYIGMVGSKSKKGVLVNWLNKKGIKDTNKVKIPIGNSFFASKDKRPEIISGHIISEMLFNLERHSELLQNSKPSGA